MRVKSMSRRVAPTPTLAFPVEDRLAAVLRAAKRRARPRRSPRHCPSSTCPMPPASSASRRCMVTDASSELSSELDSLEWDTESELSFAAACEAVGDIMVCETDIGVFEEFTVEDIEQEARPQAQPRKSKG